MKEIVSNQLRMLRLEQRLTLEQAEEITGVSYTTISAYENGTRLMSIDVICKLIESYGEQPKIFFEKCIAKMQ